MGDFVINDFPYFQKTQAFQNIEPSSPTVLDYSHKYTANSTIGTRARICLLHSLLNN